jgi:hypothetical protein
MNSSVAAPAVEEKPPKLALKFGLRLEELYAEALRVGGEP